MAPFKPNISSKDTLVFDYPVSRVYPVIASLDNFIKINPRMHDLEIVGRDAVCPPEGAPLAKIHAFDLPSAAEGGFPRIKFKVMETVTAFGQLVKMITIKITATWTTDEVTRTVVFEQETDRGIKIKWLKEMEEFQENGQQRTRLKETVIGEAPRIYSMFVQSMLQKSHKATMSHYEQLVKEHQDTTRSDA